MRPIPAPFFLDTMPITTVNKDSRIIPRIGAVLPCCRESVEGLERREAAWWGYAKNNVEIKEILSGDGRLSGSGDSPSGHGDAYARARQACRCGVRLHENRKAKIERAGNTWRRILLTTLFAVPSAQEIEIWIAGNRRPGPKRFVQGSGPGSIESAAGVYPEGRARHAGFSIWLDA